MTQHIDFLSPVLPDNPSEWVEPEPYDPSADITECPGTARHEAELAIRRLGFISPAEYERRQQIAADRWFLLRNNTLKARSRVTGRVEAYWTLGGLPLPYCGVDAVLAALERNSGETWAQRTSIEELVALGDIVPITSEYAKPLCMDIYLASHGRIDLWNDRGKETPNASHRHQPAQHHSGRQGIPARRSVRARR